MSKPKRKYKPDKLVVRYQTLEKAISEGWLKTLEYYCYLFRDGRRFFYCAKYKDIAKALGCSPQTASYHVKAMVELGLCKWNGNQLQRLKQNTSSKQSFTTDKKMSFSEMRDFLEYQLLQRNVRQQQYCIDKQKAILKSKAKALTGAWLTKDEIKLSKMSVSRTFCTDTVLSGQRYARLIKRHAITAYRKLRRYVRQGWMDIRKRFETASCASYTEYVHMKAYGIIPYHSVYNHKYASIRFQVASAVHLFDK